MDKSEETRIHSKAQGRKRKQFKAVRQLHRSLDMPPLDKMVKEPEKKKEIWELLAIREKNIHGGNGLGNA